MISFSAVALALALAQVPQQGTAAAPVAGDTTVITLDEALKLASERNLDLQVLKARLDQADEISWKAWSGYLPQVKGTGVWQVQPEVVHPAFGTVQSGEALQGQVEVTQTLFSPALMFGIRAAMKAEEAAALSIGEGRRALLFGVASAYYASASLKQALGVSQRLLEIAQRQEKDARVRFQAGTVAKVALLRAEIDRARAEQDLKRARNTFASAKIALATLLDRSPDFDVVDPPSPPLPETPDAEALVGEALRNRQDVRAARAQIGAARATRNAAIGRYFPNVAGFARRQYSDPGSILTGGENWNWQAGVALQWQILDGGLRESDLREGNAKIAEAEAAARSAEAKVRQEVRQALLDLDSARANAAKAKEQRDLATENLRLVDVSYRAGAATAVELADATAALRTAEAGATAETLGAQLAALRVLQVTGEFEPGKRR